jgi:hypothetical protein
LFNGDKILERDHRFFEFLAYSELFRKIGENIKLPRTPQCNKRTLLPAGQTWRVSEKKFQLPSVSDSFLCALEDYMVEAL